MARGEDTSRHPNRRVDNVVFGNFGHPMQNHPAFLASRGMLPQAGDDAPVHGIPRPSTGDDAPVKGIPRPKLTKEEMED